MGRKDTKAAKEAKKARTSEKAARAQAKAEVKNKKLAAKAGMEEDDDVDTVLEGYAQQQAELLKVEIAVCSGPTKRQSTAMVTSPLHGKRELLVFGGETLVDQKSEFHNDLYVYNVSNDQWRRITSPNSPMPRSGHAMCSHPSGFVLLFGGEFSSPKQSTFYHYGDTWILDPSTKEWAKVDGKSPPARSGHRMCVWKNYILMHGGFRDLSDNTTYLEDLWAFDIGNYKWQQIEFPKTMSVPDARSGHSFIPTADGAMLWGGYSKVKAGKGHYKGKVHVDTWLLKMKPDLKGIVWERRKKGGYAPTPRIGCSMVPHQGRGVLFGGVFDTEETEDNLDSQFFSSLYSYSPELNRWYSLTMRSRKKPNRATPVKEKELRSDELHDNLSKVLQNLNIDMAEMLSDNDEDEEPANQKDYSVTSQLPHERFNAALTVVGDRLFIYGGVWEHDDKEYTLDSFYSIDLSKLDGVTVYWENLGLEDDDGWQDEDDSEMDTDDEDSSEFESDEDEGIIVEDEEAEQEEIDDPRPWLPLPKPFESLTAFYRTHVNHFVEWALKSSPDARSKDLKRVAFELCQARWWEMREVIREAEDRYEEMGNVGEISERTEARSSRR